jgi:CarD family transcriptional regulator
MMDAKEPWFCPGEKVVYPGYGVGTVRCFEERSFGEVKQTFAVLDFNEAENVSIVRVPVDNVRNIGLRALSSPEGVAGAMDYLAGGEPEILSSWKDRFTEHGEKLAAGDLLSVAKVLKALWILNTRKPLSFREKKMYQKTLLLLSSEVAEVRGKDRIKVEEELLKALEKSAAENAE